jgi:hypothetical protein
MVFRAVNALQWLGALRALAVPRSVLRPWATGALGAPEREHRGAQHTACRMRLLALGVFCSLGSPAPAAAQQAASPAGIYTCTDERGRRLTSDRPIAECHNRDQRVLNRDGSVRAVIAPTMTADERAEAEARERRAGELRSTQADAYRRDRNLLNRYPDEAAHGRAREAALDSVRVARKFSEVRLKELAKERIPLTNESEFYKGKKLPAKLKQALDANEASVDAQQEALATQAVEMERVNKLYDTERERLRRLWAGAAPGSLGPAVGPVAPAASGAAAKPVRSSAASGAAAVAVRKAAAGP